MGMGWRYPFLSEWALIELGARRDFSGIRPSLSVNPGITQQLGRLDGHAAIRQGPIICHQKGRCQNQSGVRHSCHSCAYDPFALPAGAEFVLLAEEHPKTS